MHSHLSVFNVLDFNTAACVWINCNINMGFKLYRLLHWGIKTKRKQLKLRTLDRFRYIKIHMTARPSGHKQRNWITWIFISFVCVFWASLSNWILIHRKWLTDRAVFSNCGHLPNLDLLWPGSFCRFLGLSASPQEIWVQVWIARRLIHTFELSPHQRGVSKVYLCFSLRNPLDLEVP